MGRQSLDGIVRNQLGRKPRGAWTVRVFCPWGYPVVIAAQPFFDDGTLFPTMFWLTCPYLRRKVSRLEAEGWKDELQRTICATPELLEEEISSEKRFSQMLKAKGYPMELYVGGSSRPLTFKCLHAILAWFMVSRKGSAGRIIQEKIGNIYCVDKECKED